MSVRSETLFDFPDTTLFSDTPMAGQEPARAPGKRLSTDVMVYLAIAALVAATWKISQMGLFKAGDDTGYWIGVTGGVMMVLLFSYPLRKHFAFTRNWGRMKWWFLVHMVLGVGGPTLILLHSTFRVGSLNAAVAMYSMIIVALSGVVGRFLYARVNRGLHFERVTLQDLQVRAGLDEEQARSRLAFAPKVEERLSAFEQHEIHAKASWLTYVRQVFWLPIYQWLVYRECEAELRRELLSLAKHEHWHKSDYVARKKNSNELVNQYLNAVVRVVQFKAYERLFSLWHVAHIPFVYLLIISAVVHVVAVHAY
ncbi:MAG: hypothetical protein AUJ20_04750 [Comamonadaceae bacterium CG1_02_60_18]|nr:MAG: hypothetical protein AUJ20_04750 [Comamonadaceae bacterium CG1_02_60_18]PIQ56803.1 MAG: hypothetical protein COW02_00080 [Comamonadaceae bacterium CG12_big_fil_rev_8_21_14_0_65_59_15]